MPSTLSYIKDRDARMKSPVPEDQALLQRPAFQQQTHPVGFGLSTGTDFSVTEQMRPTFHQEQEACLGKRAVRALIIGTVTEGFSIALRGSYRLDRPIYGQQTHPFPEGCRGLCTR